MTPELEKLEELAKKVTLTEWRRFDFVDHDGPPSWDEIGVQALHKEIWKTLFKLDWGYGFIERDQAETLADFFAAASPTTILSLLSSLSEREREIERAKNEATSLAVHLWRSFYREEAPNWEVIPDAAGAITQIDNMVTGLVSEKNLREVEGSRDSWIGMYKVAAARAESAESRLSTLVERAAQVAEEMWRTWNPDNGECIPDANMVAQEILKLKEEK